MHGPPAAGSRSDLDYHRSTRTCHPCAPEPGLDSSSSRHHHPPAPAQDVPDRPAWTEGSLLRHDALQPLSQDQTPAAACFAVRKLLRGPRCWTRATERLVIFVQLTGVNLELGSVTVLFSDRARQLIRSFFYFIFYFYFLVGVVKFTKLERSVFFSWES